MGANFSCATCISRDDEDHCVKPLITPRDVPGRVEVSSATKDELKSHIDAIVSASKDRQKQPPAPAPRPSDAELQDQINSIIVHALASPCEQSPAWWSSDDELQDQINAIVGVHAKSLKQQRLSLADPSPSPAQSYSDADFEQYANLVLSQAKDRNTPARPSLSIIEDELAPCQLNFGDVDDTVEDHKGTVSTAVVETDSALTQIKEAGTDDPKVQTCPFDVKDIPSPTRNRAKRQQMLLEAAAQKDETPVESVVEGIQQEMAVEEAEHKVTEEEDAKYIEAAEEEAAAQMRDIELRYARRLEEIEEEAELAAMDQVCIDTFLASVKKCARHERVKTPIKGSNLYTKHMRPSRAPGTSVDVKDSSFKNLGSFLRFLEAEGLLYLQPGLTDPVVTEIRLDACRKYKYDPRRAQPFTVSVAPHHEGCCCRLCQSCTTTATTTDAFQYQ